MLIISQHANGCYLVWLCYLNQKLLDLTNSLIVLFALNLTYRHQLSTQYWRIVVFGDFFFFNIVSSICWICCGTAVSRTSQMSLSFSKVTQEYRMFTTFTSAWVYCLNEPIIFLRITLKELYWFFTSVLIWMPFSCWQCNSLSFLL